MRFAKYFIIYLTILLTSHAYSSSLPTLKDQEKLFDDIAKESWKQKEIVDVNDSNQSKIVSRYLIDTIQFNNNMCDSQLENKKNQRFKQIIQAMALDLGTTNFWKIKRSRTFTMEDLFLGRGNSKKTLSRHNSPRQQQFILNIREIIRFSSKFNFYDLNHPTTPMISEDNFATDDVIKAMSLSGSFCELKKGMLEPSFSGMLLPYQDYGQDLYFVHSCLHGFANTDLTKLHFVPYGIELANGWSPNFENSFEVKYVKKEIYGITEVTQDELNGMDQNSPYHSPDYAVALIDGHSFLNKRSLKEVLKDRQEINVFNKINLFPGFPVDDSEQCLPKFQGQKKRHIESFQNFESTDHQLKKYYIIGRPSDPRCQLNDSGFAVVTNLTNEIILNPICSLNNDPDLFMPTKVGSRNEQIAINFPNIYGMSGGIVLKTFIKEENNVRLRIAHPVGTVWGSERRFENEKFVDLNSFVNLIQ